MATETIRLGFVGVGDRGSYHLDAALGLEGIEVPALCDIDDSYLFRAQRWVQDSGRPSPRLYRRGDTDFERLCETEDLDAVICSTPWKWHTPVCLAAMRNSKHVVSEVPIVLTVDEGWQIVETWKSTGKWATLGLEGFRNLNLTHMIQQGVFGDVLHAEGGYVHDLRLVKFDPEREPWRLHDSVVRNGNLYPDHPMSNILPQLGINHGDRIEFIVSMSSSAQTLNRYAAHYYGPKHPHASTQMAQGDYNASLIRTVNGKFFTLNFDTNTPHPRSFYRVKGTKGVYWGQRYSYAPEDLVFLEGKEQKAGEFMPEFQHPILRDYHPPERAALRGHGGRMTRTPITWHRLVQALREDRMPDWDVYDSVTSSVIAPISESSVSGKSRPVDFPDFTRGEWKSRPPLTLT
jgi:predicted dehydrogenase